MSLHHLNKSFLICCFILISCFETQQKHEPIAKDTINPAMIPTHEIWGFSMAFSDSTRMRALLKAGKARVFESRNETLLDSNVFVEFMNAQSKPTGYLTAKNATINEETRDMFAKGNVFVR